MEEQLKTTIVQAKIMRLIHECEQGDDYYLQSVRIVTIL